MIPKPSSREAVTATHPTSGAPARPTLRDWRSAWITLVVGLMITAAATAYLKSRVELIAAQEFTAQCNVIQHDIKHRLVEHARILLSGAALFAASDTVTREEWHVFTHYQEIEEQLPGIQGIGFSLLIPRGELDRHVQDISRKGFPEYTVKPAGDREVYSSIIYLEPFTGRNLKAFGYDMFSEPVRRAAMERARDANTAALSGKVVLVQETGVDVQAGTLMYAPVYRKNAPIETVAQRRAALQGWVYSPYRMNDLMQGILHDRNPTQSKHLHLQIFDGAQPSPQNLLYEGHDAGDQKLRHEVRFTRQVPVNFDGQRWTLHFTQNGSGFFTEEYLGVWLTLLGGVTITLLLFALIRTLLDTRAEARRIAEILTMDLKKNEQFTADIVDSLTSSIAVLDADGIIVAVNKSWRYFALDNNLSGLSAGIGLRYLDAIKVSSHGEDADGAEAALTGIRAVMLGEQDTFTLEYPCHFPGVRRWFSMSVSKLHGVQRGAVIAHSDVTDRKQAEVALQEKHVELESSKSVAEKANLAKSEFLSSMSHELRSPLNAILGFAQLLESDTPTPTPEQKESITLILKAGWHLLKLINEILDLAKIESGQMPLLQEPVSLTEVILECREMIEPQAQQYGIQIIHSTLVAPYYIHADRTRVKQVLLNLLSNAIKYNRTQGTVEVICTESRPGRIRVSIRDTGAGLDAEQVAQLFQAFNRLGQEAGGMEGTGIGLVVARQLVELMGGVIGVESSVGVGSEFWFELIAVAGPHLSREEVEATALLRPPAPGEELLQTVLYVEDNPANLKLVVQLIARYPSIRLLTAVDGQSGIKIACESQPDVILMDINLPGIDGFEALTILRAEPATASIPVIALSANAMPTDIEKGMQAGFFCYITKPIKVNEFMEALKVALKFAQGVSS